MKKSTCIGMLSCSAVEFFLLSQSARTGKSFMIPILITAGIAVVILLTDKLR